MDYKALGLGAAASVVSDVNVTGWGSEVTVSCLYNPLDSPKPYQLVFVDCCEIQWQTIELKDVKESTADLIGFSAGAEAHQKAAVITTNIFEISIVYGKLVVRKDW